MKVNFTALIFISIISAVSFSKYYQEATHVQEDNNKAVIFESVSNSAEDDFVNSSFESANNYYQIRFFIDKPDNSDLVSKYRELINDENHNILLKNYRKEISSRIHETNLSAIKTIEKSTCLKNIEASTHSNLLTYDLDEKEITDELINKLNETLNKNTYEIENIFITEISNEYAIENSLDSTFTKINVYDMVYSKEYTGRGVSVGIIDSGLLDTDKYSGTSSTNNDYYGRNIVKKSGQSGTSDHADHVAMIAVGNNGIASGTDIYSSTYDDTINDYLGWMIDNYVNIVNTSFGSDNDDINGTYSSDAKIADQLIKDYFIVLVGSAGNTNTSPQLRVTSPKTAYNYITVGNSNNSTTTLYTNSCYREQDGYNGSKPTLIAPGYTSTNAKTNKTGTSYASPQVAGCLALLMEEFPYLKFYPELCTSFVTASASPMSSTYNNNSGDNYYDSSGLHNQIGSGLLNYEKMREAANQYLSITVPKSKSSTLGDLGQYLEFQVSNDKRIRASLAWLANGSDENNFTDYDLYLTRVEPNGTENTVMRVNGSNNNVEFLDYEVKNGGIFRLRVYKKEANLQNDYLGLSYVVIDNGNNSRSGAIEYEVDSLGEVNLTTDNFSSFGGVYNNSEISANITSNDGTTVPTKRLRAAIVEDHLVLSAKNKDAGTAYLEFHFEHYINSLEYDFGLWSSNESLILNSSIKLQCYTTDEEWYTIREFSAKEMGQDKDSLITYTNEIPYLSTGFRFIVETNMVQNDNNRGRVVLNNITIS